MSKAIKSDGTKQQALLDAMKTPLTQQVADLLLVSINLRSCKKDALAQLQTAYKAQFGVDNTEIEKFVQVRGQQAGKVPETPAGAKSEVPQEPVETPAPAYQSIPGHELCVIISEEQE